MKTESRPFPETDADPRAQSFVDRRKGDFWVNAFLGAVVSVFLSFVGVSSLAGGAVAGYLQQGRRSEGAKVGAASGVLAALPVFVALAVVLGFGFFGALVGGEFAGGLVALGVFGVVFLVVAALSGGLGAVGGYVGAILAER